MKLCWNGHSCFTIETREGTVVFDPYAPGSVPGLSPLSLKADLVLCSHGHDDHSCKEAVILTGKRPSVQVDTIATFHDPVGGKKRGPNTIHILTAEGLRVAHMGDLGCRLEEEQLKKLEGLDAMLIPVGGFFTIGPAEAKELVDRVKPRVVIPMHYRSESFGYDAIGTVEDYLALVEDVVRLPGNTLELTARTPRQTAVPTYCP